jgi:hypothetical protein
MDYLSLFLGLKASASCKHTGYGTETLRGTPSAITSKGYFLTVETNSVNGVFLVLHLVLKMYNPNVK